MKRFLKLAGPAAALLLFALALWMLHRELRLYHYHDIVAEVRAFPLGRIFASLAMTLVSYGVLTGYDTLGFRFAKRPIPYPKTAFASFISYVFSNNLGFGAVTGALVRYRLYSSFGVMPIDIAKVAGFCVATFWVGLLLIGGCAFVLSPLPIPAILHSPFISTFPIGLFFLTLSAAYLAACALVRKPIHVGNLDFEFPSFGYGVTQLLLGMLDWAASASVLYVLLPKGAIGYPQLVDVFILAQSLGLVSHVPGGLGIFETTALVMLTPSMPAPQAIGALLVYRVIYYVLPLGVAALLFGAHELYRKGTHLRKGIAWMGGWAGTAAPLAFSLSSFLGGLILLFSGATPGVPFRLRWLDRMFPLPLLEISHFLGSLAGAGLLLLARGLQQRLDAAWLLTVILLSSGVLFSLLKGVDYEEAFLLSLMLLALLPSRRHFYRKTPLFPQSFSWSWILAISTALASMLWLGLFSFKHIDYSQDLWWQFSLHGNASRFLRASVGAIGLVLLVSLRLLLRPARAAPALPNREEIEEAFAIAKAQPKTYGCLAALGDKHLFFGPSRKAFIMYGIEGHSWISMGDPVGDKEEWAELMWEFKEECTRFAAWPVFYQVGSENIPIYLDLGLSLLKIGEEARISLQGFSLEGKARHDLRYASNKAIKQGASFEIIRPEQVPPLLPALKAVSDAWLESKNTREKGFSLGTFDEGYLARFPIAIVRKNGEITAFANLWEGADKDEISVDLMRYSTAAPDAVMDYLFACVMLAGAKEGYRWFNLGMAPFSGFEQRASAPVWNKLAGTLFRHGEHFYNFQGLRNYKDKFDPEWHPRYLASPGGLALPRILANLATLISGGLKGVVSK